MWSGNWEYDEIGFTNNIRLIRYVSPDKLPVVFEIPSTLDGYTVTEIGTPNGDNDDYVLQTSFPTGGGSIVLPNTLEKINPYAFYFGDLKGELVIPEGVTIIDASAFRGNEKITSVSFPSTLITIGDYAFWRCEGLASPYVFPDSLETIGAYAFDGCYQVTGELEFPNSITTIGDHAFDHNYGLTGSLTIPENLIYLGAGAFYGCWGFTGSLYVPHNGQAAIKDETFGLCTGITSVTISEAILDIGYRAFVWCYGLTEIVFEQDYEAQYTVGEEAFALGYSHLPPAVAVVKSDRNWAEEVLTGDVINPYTQLTFEWLHPPYKKLTYENSKIQVDSIIRDGEGVKIDTNYAKLTDIPDIESDGQIDITEVG